MSSVSRWRDTLGPPVVAIAAAVALVAPVIAASAGSGAATVRGRHAVAGGAAAIAAAGTPQAPNLAACPSSDGPRLGQDEPSGAAWFRLDPVIDDAGLLTGQLLTLGAIGSADVATIALDAESFASGPLDGRILVGTDDGRHSMLRVVDAAAGCTIASLDGSGLVRRAVIEPAGAAVVEFRLDRPSRADRGIWRRPLDGSPATRLADPLPRTERIGRVFSTELAWSAERDRLVVTSCGEAACLVRIVDPATGDVVTIDEQRIGEAIGLAGESLVAYGGCPALPCEIVVHDLAGGGTRRLARLAGLAVVLPGADGSLVAFEDHATRDGIRVVGLDGSTRRRLTLDGGRRLVPAVHRAAAGVELPPGWLGVGVDGRPDDRALFVNIADGRRLPAAEAPR